ncbi:MAG: hypothetical protein QG574_5112, partial [Cyanobacteriota bacterium erpe_2018_sw_21hr_WHONDRS-SW48-000092_B_bin.40]|nr:hypothetical protein [Cyanobacteriota bacterium erpe_2018_sw_21hr_WHONDRS-SW48-000092_B_bin.40]
SLVIMLALSVLPFLLNKLSDLLRLFFAVLL